MNLNVLITISLLLNKDLKIWLAIMPANCGYKFVFYITIYNYYCHKHDKTNGF